MFKRTTTGILVFVLALFTWNAESGKASQPETQDFSAIMQLKSESRVNTYTLNHQQDPSLAIDDQGRILVAWGSRRQEFGTYGLFAQYLDPLGRPLGTEMHINSHLPGHQGKPSVAFGPDGSAWIAWCSSDQDGQLRGVYMRHLELREGAGENGQTHATLVPDGGEIRINGTSAGDQFDPAIAILEDGKVFASWISDHGGHRCAYGRLFDTDGTALGEEFRLGTGIDNHESLPALARLSGDRIAAIWARADSRGNPKGIHGRIFEASGEPAGEEFTVRYSDMKNDVEPSVDSNGNDRFVVAWMSTPANATGEYGVSASLFEGGGKPVGEPWSLDIGQEDGYLNGASAAMAPDGRFLIAWNVHHEKRARSNGHRPERHVSIHGQYYDRDGTPTGDPIRLNRFDDGEQNLQVGLNSRHIAWSALDQIALAWHGNIEDDNRGIGLTLYAPPDLNPEAPPFIEPIEATEYTYEEFKNQREAPPERNTEWEGDAYAPELLPAGPDFGFEAFQATEWTPPDPDLAVGPEYIIGVVNIWIRFFDKSGDIFLDQHLADFFGSTDFSFDPIAMYDPLVDRFVVASAEHLGSQDFVNIAVSDDNNPNGTWYVYRFNIDSYCDYVDFPNLGSGTDAYFISTDCFGWPGGHKIHIFEKAPMLSGGPVTIDNVQTSGSFNSVGASKMYDVGTQASYFASAHAVNSPNIKLYAITNATGNPQLHDVNVNVGSYSDPPDAQQLGTSNRADTIDRRIKNGVVRDGYFYICHSVNGGDGAAKSRWYKIDLRGWPLGGQDPIKVDGGDIDPGYNIDTWFGDINVDAEGNMAIAVNRSSPDELIGVYRTFRLETDPPGVTRPTVEMVTSTSPEQGSRWGDYAGLEEDPAQPGSFWNHHEYRTSGWRTWMGHFEIEPDIRLNNQTDLIPGSVATFTVSNVAPSERVWLLYSMTGEGVGPIVPRLGGTNLGLLEPVELLGAANANEDGIATIETFIPGAAPPVQVWFQAVIPRGDGGDRSVLSNVTTDTIQ